MKAIVRIMLVVMLAAFVAPAKANSLFPSDMGTISALIELHKAVAKQQHQAVARITASTNNQLLIETGTQNIEGNNNRFRSRTNNVHSWTILAGTLAKAGDEIGSLIEEYGEFQTRTFEAFKKHPQAMFLYHQSNQNIQREIKRAKSTFAGMAETTVMQATMSEKLRLAYRVVEIVEAARNIIYRAGYYISNMVPDDNINLAKGKFISDEQQKQIIKNTVSQWKGTAK